MKELIHIYENDGQYSNNGKIAISARELYESLEFAPQHWANWYKKNILKNEFAIEGEDYIQLPLSGRTLDFALSLNFAKKLSMRANTVKGNEVRDYFIEREKISYQQQNQPKSLAETILMIAQANVESEKRLNTLESKVMQLEAVKTRSDYFTIIGYATYNKIQIGLKTASKLGIKAANICRKKNLLTEEIPDPRFGKVKTYPKQVLDQVFSQPLFS